MGLTIGHRLGSYEILSALGAGGMGEVYRARDTKLGRDVALKVIPETFALDSDRLARFKREAQVLASLNHPHIGAIYGFEDSGKTHALVLELVEGDTLADRIAHGPMPLEEALPIARQICEALEVAHEQGIIHRDLKPANIKITPSGMVKVLDFGLAKLADSSASPTSNLSLSPTITSPAVMTGVGMLLGTAAYMSPEQAKGRVADKRSDIWAFGCVLYEMLTGRCAFGGDSVGDTLANVLKTDAKWSALPATTPPSIRRLLRRTLEKDHHRRLADIADARLELDEPNTPLQGTEVSARPSWQFVVPWVLASILLVAAGAVAIVHFGEPPPAAPAEARVDITTPTTLDRTSIAISPDGRTLAFVATADNGPRLWLRSLDSSSARQLPGTEEATYPFWSPNGRSVGFFADFQLKRIDVDSGLVRSLARAPAGLGGTWNTDDLIVFSPTRVSSLFSVSANGGMPLRVTQLDGSQQISHRFPQFLPDGHHFLYYVTGNADVRGIYVADISRAEAARLVDADTAGVYARGHVLFARQDKLFAQAFDPVTLVLSGEMRSVAEQIAIDVNTHAALVASTAGSIIYRTGAGAVRRQFAWFDRSGAERGRVGQQDAGNPNNASMAHDGQRLALGRYVNGTPTTWLMDVARGVVTPWSANSGFPVWSPDGRFIVFQANRKGLVDLYLRSTEGEEGETLLQSTPEIKVPFDWSADGRFFLYGSVDATTGGYSMWALPMQGQRTPTQLLKPDVNARSAQFSPDGKWIAYQSNFSGRLEVFVQPFPESTGRSQVSIAGGAQARWRPDGKELFFVALDGRLMAVPIRIDARTGGIVADTPVPLFATRIGGAVQGISRQQYMVSADGQRFLMNVVEDAGTPPLTLILNWAGTR